MANTELNSDDVSAAHDLVTLAAQSLTEQLIAKGYREGEVFFSRYGFSVYPFGMGYKTAPDGCGTTFVHAAAIVSALSWSPSLCEQTLYAGVAA